MLYLYVKDRDLYTPLHAAAASGNVECVHILINAGADIEAKNVYGNTPLHIACLNGCPLVIKALMANHVNLGESSTTGFLRIPNHSDMTENNCFTVIRRGRKLSRTNRDAHRRHQCTWCSMFQDAYTRRIESKRSIGRRSHAITYDRDSREIYAIKNAARCRSFSGCER